MVIKSQLFKIPGICCNISEDRGEASQGGEAFNFCIAVYI